MWYDYFEFRALVKLMENSYFTQWQYCVRSCLNWSKSALKISGVLGYFIIKSIMCIANLLHLTLESTQMQTISATFEIFNTKRLYSKMNNINNHIKRSQPPQTYTKKWIIYGQETTSKTSNTHKYDETCIFELLIKYLTRAERQRLAVIQQCSSSLFLESKDNYWVPSRICITFSSVEFYS